MSKRTQPREGIIPGPESGEHFMALLLWAQKGTCSCQACEYLRGMADQLIQSHVPEVKPRG